MFHILCGVFPSIGKWWTNILNSMGSLPIPSKKQHHGDAKLGFRSTSWHGLVAFATIASKMSDDPWDAGS